MLTQQTINKMEEMKLKGMLDEYKRQASNHEFVSMDFESRFGMIIDCEHTLRWTRKINRLTSRAKLRDTNACMEDIDYLSQRGLNKQLVLRLSSPEWIEKGQSIVITGPTGTGKTFLSSALGNMACRNGYKTQYYRVSRLLMEIKSSQGDGTYMKYLDSIKKLDLLILDDFGLNPFSTTESGEIFEVLEDRHSIKSTIISTQVPEKNWYDLLPDPTVADAIVDRFINTAHHIALSGDTMRRKTNVAINNNQP